MASTIECIIDFTHQREVEGGTLVVALHRCTANPARDVTCRAPILTHAEGGTKDGIVLTVVYAFKPHGIVIAEAQIAQVVLQIVEVFHHLGTRVGVVVLDVASPLALATTVRTALRVSTKIGTFVVATHVVGIPSDSLGAIVGLSIHNGIPTQVGELACVIFLWEVQVAFGGVECDVAVVVNKIPGSEATAMVCNHVFYGTGASFTIGIDEVA